MSYMEWGSCFLPSRRSHSLVTPCKQSLPFTCTRNQRTSPVGRDPQVHRVPRGLGNGPVLLGSRGHFLVLGWGTCFGSHTSSVASHFTPGAPPTLLGSAFFFEFGKFSLREGSSECQLLFSVLPASMLAQLFSIGCLL